MFATHTEIANHVSLNQEKGIILAVHPLLGIPKKLTSVSCPSACPTDIR